MSTLDPEATKPKLTESPWAFWFGIVGSIAGILGAAFTILIFHLGGQIADRQKTYDLAASLAPFLFDDAPAKQKFALDMLRSFWEDNQDGVQANVARLVVSTQDTLPEEVQKSMRSLLCTAPKIFIEIFHEDAELQSRQRLARLITDISVNTECQGKYDSVAQEARALALPEPTQPAVNPPNQPQPFVSKGVGFSVYVASDRTKTNAVGEFLDVQQRLSKLNPPMVAYLMRPARLPCWWGITVGYDLAQPQALTQRNRAREAGYKDAYVTASIPEAAARAACGDAWKDP